MKPYVFRTFIFTWAPILALTGCASLSESDCRNAQWESRGHIDGSSGTPYSRLQSHREACAEYGIDIDEGQYRNGYERGLRHYCTPSNGYRVGTNGSTYYGVCKGNAEPLFLAQYQKGKREFETKKRLEAINSKMAEIYNKLKDSKLDARQREALNHERRDLEREKSILLLR
jgi:hypothetical protein